MNSSYRHLLWDWGVCVSLLGRHSVQEADKGLPGNRGVNEALGAPRNLKLKEMKLEDTAIHFPTQCPQRVGFLISDKQTTQGKGVRAPRMGYMCGKGQ